MNPNVKITEHVLHPAKLDELMKKDFPVVPPDSIIKTFSHLKGQDVGLVLTQDKDGLSAGSFIVRNGDWAEFFLETWLNPLYQSYNFQKAETHALVSLSFLTMTLRWANRKSCRNTSCSGTQPCWPRWLLSTRAC